MAQHPDEDLFQNTSMTFGEHLEELRAALFKSLIALVGGGLTFLDLRHASAMDVQQLTKSIESDRLDRLEFQIEEIERYYKRIKAVPVLERSAEQEGILLDLEIRKARSLRKLERIQRESEDD
jgi:hypothetical protein